jgi:hypothetical protein
MRFNVFSGLLQTKKRFVNRCVVILFNLRPVAFSFMTSTMRTKLLFCIAFFCNCFTALSAQEYHPLLNNTSWVISNTVSCCRPTITRTIVSQGEQVIGNHTYVAYIDPRFDNNTQFVTMVYLREDVAERKVYKIVDGVDMLLYDYSLETGDTIFQYGRTWTARVGEVMVNDGPRKMITLLSPYNQRYNVKQIWIEGVGTNKHPFNPIHNMYSFLSASGGVMISTGCVYQNDKHILGNEEYCAQMLATTTESYTNPDITFTPNPVNTELTIKATKALENGNFKLYNLQGQLVREMYNLNGKLFTVNRENLSRGLYLAELFEDGQLVKSAKLIVD